MTIVFVNTGAAARFAGAMDLAMTDPYPIPTNPPGNVAGAVRTVRDAVTPRIPLWLVPQAFGGNEWWSREPTAAELRLMTWIGIVEGATGVQYFIRHGLSGFPKSPDTWAAAAAPLSKWRPSRRICCLPRRDPKSTPATRLCPPPAGMTAPTSSSPRSL